MHKGIHELGRWSFIGLAGLIVQDYFHGLELGAWIYPIIGLLVAASFVFLFTWKPFTSRIPYRLVDVRKKTPEPPHHPPSPAPKPIRVPYAKLGPLDTELAKTAALHYEKLVRGNVQAVLDELAWAHRLVKEAAEDNGGFWKNNLKWDKWDSLKPVLADEAGFSLAYNATRDAWDALQRAEVKRLEHEDQYGIQSWEIRRIEEALQKTQIAEDALLAFLARWGSD